MSMPPPPPPSDPFPRPPGSSFPPQPPGVYPSPPPGFQYAQAGRTSGLAIASLVLGILWLYWIGSILAVIFGHVVISQSHRDETLRGRGMAIAGLVLGYVGIALLILGIIVVAADNNY